MPRLAENQVPSYRLHKQSGQAVVTLGGRDVLLGKFGTPSSREKYNRVIAEWLAAGRQLPATAACAGAAAGREPVRVRTLTVTQVYAERNVEAAQRGVRGVRLETVWIGGTRCTSRPTVRRFIDQLSAARDAGAGERLLTATREAERLLMKRTPAAGREIEMRPRQPMCGSLVAMVLVGVAPVAAQLEAEASSPASTRPGDDQAVLSRALERLLTRGDVIDATRKVGQSDAAAATQPASRPAREVMTVAEIIAEVKRVAPEVFEVTAEQSRRLQTDDHDPASAKRRIDAALAVFRDFKMKLPQVTIRLIELYQSDKLHGLELEVTARVLEAWQRVLAGSVMPDRYPRREPLPS